jgi:uncharacterized protein
MPKKLRGDKKLTTASKKRSIVRKTTASKPVLSKTPSKKAPKKVTVRSKTISRPAKTTETFEITLKRPAPQISNTEQAIEESKFFALPPAEKKAEFRDNELPYNYGETLIVLMIRDPHWLYAYWEVTEEKYKEARASLGNNLGSAKEILRVYDTTTTPWKSFDITINPGARNWYINVPESEHSYLVDIGYLAADGTFILLARSNRVKMPLDKMSDVIDEEWMTIDYDRMYALSGGFGIGKSSGEIKKLMEKYLHEQRSSGWVSSFSSPMMKPAGERPFFLVANTELIVYGATEPTAKLFIQGKQVPLRHDGTFNLRFALPDGEQNIPIEAIRDDEQEKRQITKKVNKRTT